jgi:hypothetical protein
MGFLFSRYIHAIALGSGPRLPALCHICEVALSKSPINIDHYGSFMKQFYFAAALTAVFATSPAVAVPTSFFDDLSGNWSGSGKAYLAKFGEVSANCRLSASGGGTHIDMKGSCGMLVFRQALGLTLRNAGGNRFTGTYTGSKTGPAKLDGILHDDRLVLNIRWGGLVNGDRSAQMVLERTGPDSFAQTVVDKVSGKTRNTSRFAFKRR